MKTRFVEGEWGAGVGVGVGVVHLSIGHALFC